MVKRGFMLRMLLKCRRRGFSLAVRTPRSCLLFDCGEDTQRALLQAPHVRPSRITRIFVSCLDGDQVCGLPGELHSVAVVISIAVVMRMLPQELHNGLVACWCACSPEVNIVVRWLVPHAGMLCTISAAREKGHDMADVPVRCFTCRPPADCRLCDLTALFCLCANVLATPLLQLHVYGPRGVAQFINAMLRVSDTYLLMPVVIHELSLQPPNLAGWQPHEVQHRA
jgi:ribonuclease Z